MRRIKFKALQELQKLHLLTAVILATAFIIFTTVTVRGDEEDEYDLSPYTTIIPLTAPVPALEPLEETHIETDDHVRIIRSYRLNRGTNAVIPRENFTWEGLDFMFYELRRVDEDNTRRRQQTYTLEIETRTSDITGIMAALPRVHRFEDTEGFVGYLNLKHESITTVPRPAVFERRTMTHTINYTNIAFGDISGIARSVTQRGVTLELVDVSWTRNTTGVDFNPVAVTYNAVAHFRGHYSVSVIPGFLTRADYVGEVILVEITPHVIYEAVFIAQRETEPEEVEFPVVHVIDETTPEVVEPVMVEEEQPVERRSLGFLLWVIVLILALAVMVTASLKLGLFSLDKLKFWKRGNEDYSEEEED